MVSSELRGMTTWSHAGKYYATSRGQQAQECEPLVCANERVAPPRIAARGIGGLEERVEDIGRGIEDSAPCERTCGRGEIDEPAIEPDPQGVGAIDRDRDRVSVGHAQVVSQRSRIIRAR